MQSSRPLSTSRIAGQLRYLLEERPELRAASVEALRDRLSLEDRYARARARYPLADQLEIAARVADFEDRVGLETVRAARTLATERAVDREPAGRGELGAAGDDTPPWLFLAAAAFFVAGLIGWCGNLAVSGPGPTTWTGGALLVVLGLAIGSAIWSHRHAHSW